MPAVGRKLVNQGSGPVPHSDPTLSIQSLATGPCFWGCALEPSTTPGPLVGDLCTEILPPALTPVPRGLFLEG